MKYLFILNPISGINKNPQKIADLVEQNFKDSGHEFKIAFTTHAGNAFEISQEAANEKYDIIVAAGGDGTINEVASGLIDSEAALGIIPLGSGNGVARSYGIPLNIEDSINFLVNPKIVKVDVGKINNHFFLGVCGMGYDAIVGQKFQEFGKRGPLPYFLIGVREFLRFKPEKLNLKFNNKSITISPLLITVSNTEQYGNGAIISPNANPRDGILEICIINPMPIHKAIKSSFKLFNSKIAEIPEYIRYQCTELTILSEKDGVYHTDGEPHDRGTETTVRILPGAMNACANFN